MIFLQHSLFFQETSIQVKPWASSSVNPSVRMVQLALCITISFIVFFSSSALAVVFLSDDFNGTAVTSGNWHIPTWKSSSDGTFVGRTQFRCTQNSPLPAANQGNAIITVESYNPTDSAGASFYGTDLISNQIFSQGIHVTVRAKMNTAALGIVGGIFLYALKPGSSTLHDEIDFELLTNKPNGAQTNIYGNEPLGVGNPQFASYASGTISDYHTYEIKWMPTQVSWLVDGKTIRTDTAHVPSGPMYFHLNIWVPASDWAEAYSSSLQPTNLSGSNQKFSMSVDSITIQSAAAEPASSILYLLPLGRKK